MYKRALAVFVVVALSAAPSIAMTMNSSWYGPGFHGKKTASGERFNQNAMTAAHKTLPFGTHLALINPDNGRKACVTINDRGPFHPGRQLDVSKAVAKKLGFEGAGTADLRVQQVARCS
jgi:rare lipoprotein A